MISLLTLFLGLCAGMAAAKVHSDVKQELRQRSKSGYTPFRR